MVTRVTSQAQQSNSLKNIFRITENLFKTQQEIASGKRINKPSDDPAGLRDALSLRTSIARSNQFVRNVDNNRIYLQSGESALDSVNINLVRAKELAVQSMGALGTAETRGYAVNELDQIIAQTIESANIKVKNQYVFAGTAFRTQPFDHSASGAVYLGNSDRFEIAVGTSTNTDFTLTGSETFANDLDPKLTNKDKSFHKAFNDLIAITFEAESKTFEWSVRSGNRTVDAADCHYVTKVLFKIVREYDWKIGERGETVCVSESFDDDPCTPDQVSEVTRSYEKLSKKQIAERKKMDKLLRKNGMYSPY